MHAKLDDSHVEVWWGEKGGALSKIIDNNNVNLTAITNFLHGFAIMAASKGALP